MAKKDRLKNLLGAITESPVQEQPQEEVAASTMDQENRVASEVVKELGISPEMTEERKPETEGGEGYLYSG